MKFYCLNIETATDRRAYCESEFRKAGIDVEFVAAFDTQLNRVRHQNMQYRVGHLGCYLSHLRLMEEVRRQDVSPAIVFEDDVQLADDFKNKLDEALLTLPDDWEVALIGWWPAYHDHSKIKTELVTHHWMRITAGIIWGCYGYMINGKKGGDKLIQLMQPIVNHIDDRMMADIVSGRIKGYFLRTPLVNYTEKFVSQTRR